MVGMAADSTLALSGEDALRRVIAAMAGPEARPRDDQLRAVAELVDHRRRVLVVQATGWGKSAVYWAATTALRSQGAGPTLVVSPLLALMRDQIAAAERAGLRAATVNSTNIDEWDVVLANLSAGMIDVLLISPERLANPGFARRLPELLVQINDERHAETAQVRNVLLAVRLARHTARGWDNAALPDDVRDIAALLTLGEVPTLQLLRDIDR